MFNHCGQKTEQHSYQQAADLNKITYIFDQVIIQRHAVTDYAIRFLVIIIVLFHVNGLLLTSHLLNEYVSFVAKHWCLHHFSDVTYSSYTGWPKKSKPLSSIIIKSY